MTDPYAPVYHSHSDYAYKGDVTRLETDVARLKGEIAGLEASVRLLLETFTAVKRASK